MESYPTWPNLAAMMFERAEIWPHRPMLRSFRDGGWRSLSWGDFARQAAAAARALRVSGVAAGDRVCIVSENRPEYPIAETALLAIRAVPVPTYTTNTPADHAHILRDSGSRAAIVSTAALAARVIAGAAAARARSPRHARSHGRAGGGRSAASLGAVAAPDRRRATARRYRGRSADDPAGALACLIYTSGTSGAPKGVMLPHRAILANCRGAFELLRPLRLKDEVYLSFLPLSHSYEHTAGQFFCSASAPRSFTRAEPSISPPIC